MEKKKMGRPTEDPKIITKRARMSEKDAKKLKECCRLSGLSESEALRKGLDMYYAELTKGRE